MSDKKEFTHYGWLHGVVPVYVDMTDDQCPGIELRHWSLLPWAFVFDTLHSWFCVFTSMLTRDFEPNFAIKLTGRIVHE